MSTRSQLRISVLGRSEQAKAWSAAVERVAQLYPQEEPVEAAGALVIAPGAADPFARAKEALSAGVPVLHAAPFLLSPWQTSVLQQVSRRRQVLLSFSESFRYRPGFAFLRRALQGREPLWRPVYLRALTLARSGGPRRLDEIAMEQLALCDALLDWQPRQVVAAGSHRDDAGELCAAFISVHSGDAPAAHCTVSLAEVMEARQLVVATPDCTVVLDDLDPIASLRVLRAGEEEALVRRSHQVRSERLLTPDCDPVAAETEGFVEAVSHGGLSASNAERWVRVASCWWAARQSIAFGGAREVPAALARETEPPPLRVIEGGGRSGRSARSRAALSLVSR